MFKQIKNIHIYFLILILSALALGFSDAVIANYFKDAYDVTAFQRGLIEFPRELPGVLCVVLIALLSFLGDLRIAIISQILCAIGILVLGFTTPPFAIMLIFLFINSLGMHLFFPLQDSIGMALIENESVGKRMGQYKGISTAFTLVASAFVFFGFRSGIFSFTKPIKLSFVIAGFFFILIVLLFILLQKRIDTPIKKDRTFKLFFKKTYQYYYILAIMNGVQKQVMIVYGPWVLIDILGQKADTLALIGMGSGLIGIFFLPSLGKWIDRFGVRKMLFADAISFIVVYIAYGLLSAGFVNGSLATVGFPVVLTIFLLIIDKMSMQMSMIRTVYLRGIAESPEDITPTLSMGISMDHVVTIIAGALGGIVWSTIGPQYIFFFAAALSFVNLFVAFKIKETR